MCGVGVYFIRMIREPFCERMDESLPILTLCEFGPLQHFDESAAQLRVTGNTRCHEVTRLLDLMESLALVACIQRFQS